MKRFAVVAVIAALALTGCGSQIPAQQSYAVVYGRVFDASTNQPLPGVDVSVLVAIHARSGSDGTFTTDPIVPAGQIDVQVQPPAGYKVADPSVLNFSVTAGERYRLDIALIRS